MRILTHIHHLNQLTSPLDPAVDLLVTEHKFSYKHPYLQNETDFFRVLEACLKTEHKTYIEINGFIQESDLEDLSLWLKTLLNHPITGFYFADLAILMMLKQLNYQGECIYAPETILTNTIEIRTLLKSVDRVMISKELTLDEIELIAKAFPNQIEIFGAGHLQMSVSRRPLLSSYLSEIGKTKIVLNQTDFRLQELKRKDQLPILEESQTFCVFTQAILNPIEELKQLEQADVYGMHFDPLFIEEKAAQSFFNFLVAQNKQFDLKQSYDFYQSVSLPFFKGYFYRKTNTTKGSL